MRRCFFCFALFFSSAIFANSTCQEESRISQLEKCLLELYRIDSFTSALIIEKFSPLLENHEYESVIDLFLEESNKLNMYSDLPPKTLEEVTSYHLVLFENEHVRVSWAVTKSGEQEPFQRHPWKTLMVVIQSSQFYSEREDGVSYEDNWPVGVYLLDPSLDLLSCKNIGLAEYNGLVFEIK